MAGLLRLLRSKWNPPAPPPSDTSFTGKTILITGATGGLGLEAAKKIATLNPSRLIITARTEQKGAAAKQEIERYVASMQSAKTALINSTEIVPMVLNMSDFHSIKSFADSLKKAENKLDAAILNAGLSSAQYNTTVDGWEETLQVNTVGTVLLAMLILPLLLAAAKSPSSGSISKPHLTFISSGLATTATPTKMQQFLDSSTPVHDISKATSFPQGRMGGQAQYTRSKLLLEYAMRHIANLPEVKGSSDGQPKVIVNSVCPGMCKSDLGRQFNTSIVVKILLWIIFLIFARTGEQGANAYVSAIMRDESGHGKLWKNDDYAYGGLMIEEQPGIKFGDTVWTELKGELEQLDAGIKPLLV